MKKIMCYIIGIITLFLVIIIIKRFMFQEEIENISYEIKSYNKIEYPYFNNKVINKEIKNFLNNFKGEYSLQYSVYQINDLVNVFISLKKNNNYYYKSINYNIRKRELINNNEVINYDLLNDLILNKIRNKYSNTIYESILNDKFNSAYIKICEDNIFIYFGCVNTKYEVYIVLNDTIETNSEVINKKMVAFTFDDGPSIYTKDFVNTLNEYGFKATFFELGNRIKYNQGVVEYLLNNGMEVASHSYSHKNLNILGDKEIDSEVNSTSIIFNEITKESIKLFRPPYGNLEKSVLDRINYPIIMWDIDSYDWLYKDEEIVYKNIINNIKDGSIVLMHDVYITSLEALKKVLPELKAMGYVVTTVSELASSKGYILENKTKYYSFR